LGHKNNDAKDKTSRNVVRSAELSNEILAHRWPLQSISEAMNAISNPLATLLPLLFFHGAGYIENYVCNVGGL
jgi:hypothetical protein